MKNPADMASMQKEIRHFEILVCNNEKDYEHKLKSIKDENSSLNEEAQLLRDKSKILSSEIMELNAEIASREADSKNLTSLKDSFLISIEILSKENGVYMSDLKKSKYEIFNLEEKITDYEAILNRRNESVGVNEWGVGAVDIFEGNGGGRSVVISVKDAIKEKKEEKNRKIRRLGILGC